MRDQSRATLMRYPLVVENVEAAATLLGAISSETRLYILNRLLGVEATVSDLADEVGISQPALSQHLAKLKRLGLVRTRRDAQSVYYRSDDVAVRKLLGIVSSIPVAATAGAGTHRS